LGNWAPAWSPAGDALAFVAETKAGIDVYVLSLTDLSSPPTNVSRSGDVAVDQPAWSLDGTWLVYATAQGLHWVGVENPAHPGTPHRLTRVADDGGPAIDPRDDGIFFHRPGGSGEMDLYRVSWEGSEPELVRQKACCVAVRP
jgi:Tol biopolymer transport system component